MFNLNTLVYYADLFIFLLLLTDFDFAYQMTNDTENYYSDSSLETKNISHIISYRSVSFPKLVTISARIPRLLNGGPNVGRSGELPWLD